MMGEYRVVSIRLIHPGGPQPEHRCEGEDLEIDEARRIAAAVCFEPGTFRVDILRPFSKYLPSIVERWHPGGAGENRLAWREAPFAEAMERVRGRTILPESFGGPWPRGCRTPAAGLRLDDGSVVVCCSLWTEPTPQNALDVEAVPPGFWIGVPRGGRI